MMMDGGVCKAQLQNTPMQVEWERNDRPDFRSSGTVYTSVFIDDVPVYTGVPAGELPNPTALQSGVDWHIAMTKVYEDGVFTGYVTVGYMGWSMWGPAANGCLAPGDPNPNSNFPPLQPISFGNATGSLRMAVARYGVDNELLWYRAYHDDILFGVIQDSNGDIVVTGLGKGDNANAYADMAAAPVLKVNPTSGTTTETFQGLPCPPEWKSHMLVMKLALETGDILWNHYYTDYAALTEARVRESRGYDLVETSSGYRVVGLCNSAESTVGGTVPQGKRRPYMVQLDMDGNVEWMETLLTEDDDAATTALWTTGSNIDADFRSIDHMIDPGNGDDLIVINGERSGSAFIQLYREEDPNVGYVQPEWTKDIATADGAYPIPPGTASSHSTDVTFHTNGDGSVIWPVFFDKVGAGFTAIGEIYKLAPATGGLTQSTSIGELHAYDRRIGLVSMTNGNIGVCSTKHPVGYSVDGLQYGWNDLPPATRSCLQAISWPLPLDWTTAGAGPSGAYNFYGSQSYVAELDGTGLSLVWEKQWQHALQPSDDCYPGNVRRRQCNFQIVESPDGGLVVCGNTGHNFDDAMLVKLKPCESFFTYANLPLDQNDEYHITAATTWSTEMYVRGKIVVDNGATLTVDGATIHFADGRQTGVATNISVKRGGTLNVINGAVLTNIETCGGSMWDGISVIGTTGGGTQGEVYINTGSTVRNALTAVLAGQGDPGNPGYNGPYIGGLVDIRDATLENNLFDVVIHGIPNGTFAVDQWVIPFFLNVQFKTTAHLNYAGLDPKAHVRVADHGQVKFYGCTFANDLPTHWQSHRMGYGIETLNANVSVWPAAGQPASSVFRNLDHAIHSVASAGSPYTNVVQSTFVDNICAVYQEAVPGFSTRGNIVTMGGWEGISMTGLVDAQMAPYHRAIFTTLGYGFSIQDNALGRSPGNTTPLEGIVAGYTADHNDIIYRNQASDLERAFVGEGICADVAGAQENFIGLQYQCNSNSGNLTNLMSRKAEGATLEEQALHTIRGYQGRPELAAGNQFDQDPAGLDFEMNTTRVPVINYYYDPAQAAQEPQYYTQAPGTSELQPVQITGSANACVTGPGVIGGGTTTSLKPVLQANKVAYGNIRYLYDNLIDGGHTDEVVLEITSAWPQDIWELRSYLLSKSPYLSVDALKTFVNKDGIPIAIKAEILIANPEATQKEGFLKWAELEAAYPIPAYVAESIIASWNTKTYRSILELQMGEKHANMTQAANHLLYLYQSDTTPPDPDTLRWVWQQVRTRAARYAEASLLMGLGKFVDAHAMITAMPVEKALKPLEAEERTRMLTYISLLKTAAGQGRNQYQLSITEVDALETMVAHHYDRPSNWASNLLCAVYGRCRAPYTGGDGRPKSRSISAIVNTNGVTVPMLRVYPNPSNSWVAFEHTLPDSKDNAVYVIRDGSGRQLAELSVLGDRGQRVWDVRGLAGGFYTVELVQDGRVLLSERLVIEP